MSLFKQLGIMLSLFLTVILVLVMMLNFKSATEFVQNQLYTDAKNTAHSLGLSLSKVADPSDASSMETMINAIYDSGYYQRIHLTNIEGKTIYTRACDIYTSDVPQWFIKIVPIHNTSASSDIMIGWKRFGTLTVSGHTGNAYRQLYSIFIDLVQTFLMIGGIVFLLLYFFLSLSLKSLTRIKEQAKAIIDNEFIIEKKIPFTTEFRSVTTAMNAMVEKVKVIFEHEDETLRHYYELMYKDSETNLHNRHYLTVKLPDYLQSEASLSSGVYVMLSIDNIDRFKREKGYERYGIFVKSLSEVINIQFTSFPHALIARLNESEFFVVIPGCEVKSIIQQIEQIMVDIRQAIEEVDKSLLDYFVIGYGIGTYDENDSLKSLFSRADHTVSKAKMCGQFVIDIKESASSLILGREEWREELLKSMDDSRMLLAIQRVVEKQNGVMNIMHEEIFLRLRDHNGTIHTASNFIPVAMNLGLIDTLDRYMIQKVFKHIQEHSPVIPLALNLSGDFVKKYANIQWLREHLESFSKNNNLVLWFEVSNITAVHESEAVATIRDMVKTYGYRFGIDHFTIPEAGAHYLQTVRPDYIKSNSTYLQDMMIDQSTGENKENFNNIIRSLGISIIVVNIEDPQDEERLKALGIGQFQGSYISPVTLL